MYGTSSFARLCRSRRIRRVECANQTRTANYPWVPVGVSFVEPLARTLDWKVDDVDEPSKKMPNATTVHVRRRRLIQGRSVMPGA